MTTKVTYKFIIPIGKTRYFQSNVELNKIWSDYFDAGKVTSTKTIVPLEDSHKVVLEATWLNDEDYNDFESKISVHTDAMNEYNRINNIQVTRVIEKL
jgi:hypothetical protein